MRGLAEAPLTAGDAAAVTAVWQACEIDADGAPDFEEADVVAFTQRPSFDFARHTRGVRDGGELVAFGVVLLPRISFVHVLPAHRGRGIGTRLLGWSEETARAAGMDDAAQDVSDNDPAAIALLEAHGYERQWDSWAFAIALEREPPPPALPGGYAIRAFVRGQDDRAVYDVIQRAFGEWPDYRGSAFEDWSATTLDRPGFDPELLSVLVHGDRIAGTVLLVEAGDEGWIDQVAVAREHRGNGLGLALLVHAFGQTWRLGLRRCALGTDSRTGARGLYEHVGMRVRASYGEYRKAL